MVILDNNYLSNNWDNGNNVSITDDLDDNIEYFFTVINISFKFLNIELNDLTDNHKNLLILAVKKLFSEQLGVTNKKVSVILKSGSLIIETSITITEDLTTNIEKITELIDNFKGSQKKLLSKLREITGNDNINLDTLFGGIKITDSSSGRIINIDNTDIFINGNNNNTESTPDPSPSPSPDPSPTPSPSPSPDPSPSPSPDPSPSPSPDPSPTPSPDPSPTSSPDPSPTSSPDPSPTPTPPPEPSTETNINISNTLNGVEVSDLSFHGLESTFTDNITNKLSSELNIPSSEMLVTLSSGSVIINTNIKKVGSKDNESNIILINLINSKIHTIMTEIAGELNTTINDLAKAKIFTEEEYLAVYDNSNTNLKEATKNAFKTLLGDRRRCYVKILSGGISGFEGKIDPKKNLLVHNEPNRNYPNESFTISYDNNATIINVTDNSEDTPKTNIELLLKFVGIDIEEINESQRSELESGIINLLNETDSEITEDNVTISATSGSINVTTNVELEGEIDTNTNIITNVIDNFKIIQIQILRKLKGITGKNTITIDPDNGGITITETSSDKEIVIDNNSYWSNTNNTSN